MPYIKLKVYGQTVLLDGGHGRNGGHGRIARPLDPPVQGCNVAEKQGLQTLTSCRLGYFLMFCPVFMFAQCFFAH